MSYDSEIASYQSKIDTIKKAKPEINKAIKNYNAALDELKNIKNVTKCETLKKDISTKISDLEDVKKKIDNDIAAYNLKIESLRAAKAEAEERARREAEEKEKEEAE